MTELMKHEIGDDLLILDSTTGYSPNVDDEVFRVMYAEFTGEDSSGVKEFETMNMELYTKLSAAYAVFSFRKMSDNPEKDSEFALHRLRGESLADILGAALAKK